MHQGRSRDTRIKQLRVAKLGTVQQSRSRATRSTQLQVAKVGTMQQSRSRATRSTQLQMAKCTTTHRCRLRGLTPDRHNYTTPRSYRRNISSGTCNKQKTGGRRRLNPDQQNYTTHNPTEGIVVVVVGAAHVEAAVVVHVGVAHERSCGRPERKH